MNSSGWRAPPFRLRTDPPDINFRRRTATFRSDIRRNEKCSNCDNRQLSWADCPRAIDSLISHVERMRRPHLVRLRSVTGEQKIATFHRYVTGKTTAKPGRIDRLSLVKLRESPPTRRYIFL